MNSELRERLERLLAAARRLADPDDREAARARRAIAQSSGLSVPGVELALEYCLELAPSNAELEALAASVRSARRAHVLLSANVFVAAHRAIALGLASAPELFVRPSRREPETARFLAAAAPGLFEIVAELEPEPGDELFAYGADATLAELERSLRAGARLNGYGSGFGLVALDEHAPDDGPGLTELAEALTLDHLLFDQRGCLSPRLIVVQAPRERALALAEALAKSFAGWAERVPRGRLVPAELAEIRRYEDTLTYAGDFFAVADGAIGVSANETALEPAPVGRVAHIVPVADAARVAARLAPELTTLAVRGSKTFEDALFAAAPQARKARPGTMQRPAFDGPADPRSPR